MPDRLYGWQETGSGWVKTDMPADPTFDAVCAASQGAFSDDKGFSDDNDVPFLYVPTRRMSAVQNSAVQNSAVQNNNTQKAVTSADIQGD